MELSSSAEDLVEAFLPLLQREAGISSRPAPPRRGRASARQVRQKIPARWIRVLSASRRDEVVESEFLHTLRRQGWSDHAAQAAYELGGAYPWGENADAPWRNAKMRDWCSAFLSKPPTDSSSQWLHIDYTLKNLMQPIWQDLQKATTVEDARKALEPYFNNLNEGK